MSGVLTACRTELTRIFTVKPAFAVLILAAVVYAAFYPQPYVNEALRHVPIALVDRDGTTTSRDFARRLAATSDVSIVAVLPDLPSAQREVLARQLSGIVVIPQFFERDLLHGRAAPVALYADASYVLIYQRVSGAVAGVARAMGAEIEAARLIALGVDRAVAVAASDPMPLTVVNLFNPQGGYATYVLPAAFVLILQQCLMIGVAILGTTPPAAGRAPIGRVESLLGKLLAYVVVEAVILPSYLIGVLYLYGVPRLGTVINTLALAVPFVLAVASLGMVIAAVFRRPLVVQLVAAAVGLPFFFLAGFAWPAEAIPEALRLIALLVPSTSAIDGFVRLDQMGASLPEVRTQILILSGLALVYGLIALALTREPASERSGAT